MSVINAAIKEITHHGGTILIRTDKFEISRSGALEKLSAERLIGDVRFYGSSDLIWRSAEKNYQREIHEIYERCEAGYDLSER